MAAIGYRRDEGEWRRIIMSGPRVRLRAVDADDRDDILRWMHDADIIQFLEGDLPPSPTEESDWIADKRYTGPQSQYPLSIVRLEDDAYVGACGLIDVRWRHRAAMMGIVIAKQSDHGHGYGTEATALLLDVAFRRLNLHRVALRVHAEHDRAQRCYKRLGFQLEGTMRKDHFSEGRYRDVHVMGILAGEWEENRDAVFAWIQERAERGRPSTPALDGQIAAPAGS